MFPHLVQGEETLFFDGFANLTFVHAIAAAHLGGVAHALSAGLTFMTYIAQIGFAKHELVSNVCYVASIAQELEIPTAIDRIAKQAGPNQLIVLNHELFINTVVRVAEHNFFSVRRAF